MFKVQFWLNVWQWIKSYSGNIFSVIGIILTIYFGAFYIPDALHEAEIEKLRNAQINIIQSFKELAYSDSTFTTADVAAIYDAEKIRIGEPIPLSKAELISSTQGAFMADKFLPLSQRRVLLRKLESLKDSVEAIEGSKANLGLTTVQRKTQSWQFLSIIFTILASLVGSFGIYYKFKRDKANEAEIKNDADTSVAEASSLSWQDYESNIRNVLSNYPGITLTPETRGRADRGIDIIFQYKERRYYVQVKYLVKNKLGLHSINSFMDAVKGMEGHFWFIYNSDVTPLVQMAISDSAAKIGKVGQLQFIKLAFPEMLREKLPELLGD